MVSAIVYQLTRNLSIEEIEKSGFDTYFVDHTTGLYPVAASGTPFSATYFQSKGDLITDLHEDMAADAAIMKQQLIPGQSQKISRIEHRKSFLFLLVIHAVHCLTDFLVTGAAAEIGLEPFFYGGVVGLRFYLSQSVADQ